MDMVSHLGAQKFKAQESRNRYDFVVYPNRDQ